MCPIIETYGCYSKDDAIRLQSSSGGVFTVLAEYFIHIGGIVYGTSMSDDLKKAVCVRIDRMEDLSRLRGSKYLQSDMGLSFRQIKEDAESGRKVLFSGTPCQVNGLKKYLMRTYENIFFLDVICHGVPTQRLWEKNIESIERKNHRKVFGVAFRSKDNSWRKSGMKYFFESKSVFISKEVDPYLQMFLKNYCLRQSCYHCNAKTIRYADLTLGDLWGVNKIAPVLDDGKGTSAVIIRTQRGMELFQAIKSKLTIVSISYLDVVKYNPAENCSVDVPLQRENFFRDMEHMNFGKLNRKYCGSVVLRYLKRIKSLLREKLAYKSG